MPAALRSPIFLVALASALILAAAFGFQYIGGLAPCELCWWQRYVYMGAIPLAVLGYSLEQVGGRTTSRWLLGLLSLIFLGGASIAVFHVGVEEQWWRGLESCTANTIKGSVEMMLKELMTAPVVRCDKIAWSLFGISMAGYNAILSLGLAAYCAANARKPRKTP